ncbi:MAG: ABC transporter ATP-binding protein [Dehalococcoidia bacterium]|nr:ABC transporter ATP-binding protein [Dehalococcoidia bacterium]
MLNDLSSSIIQGTGLVKKYKKLVAVDHIDFTIERQECFAFLGPNGAGKTTTIRMICCYAPLTSGKLTVDGKDVSGNCREIKRILGIVPQETNLDPDLTVGQNLLVYSRYFDIPGNIAVERATEALETFQLVGRWNNRIDSLSGGMKRRLIFARALINQPRILILDEPTTGLDPQAKHLVWQKIRYLKDRGTTIVLSTQNMEEAAHLCDRLVVMHQGKILTQGTPTELIDRYAGKEVLEIYSKPENKPAVLSQLLDTELEVEDVGDTIFVFSRDGGTLRQRLNINSEKIVYRQATLEDVFLRLTGRGLQE